MNKEHGFQSPDDLLDAAIEAMKSTPVSIVSDELIDAKSVHMPSLVDRRLDKRRWVVQTTLAASILLGIAAFYWMHLSVPTTAFAQVLQQVEKTKTFQGKVIMEEGSGTLTVWEDRMRFVSFEGRSEAIADAATKKSIQMDHVEKIAYHIEGNTPLFMLDLVQTFRELAASATQPVNDYVAPDGKRYPGLKGKTEWKVEGKSVPVEIQVWTDPNTKLPVRMKIIPQTSPDEAFVIDEAQFDLVLDESKFDLKVPEGYQEFGQQELKEPLSRDEAAKLVIKPGVGVGQVTFGMSRDELVAIMGEPEIDQFDTYLSYPSIGVQFCLTGRRPDRIGLIILNPADAANLKRHDFPGKTAEGIGIGSTREEVIAAFGKPDKESDQVPANVAAQRIYYKDHAILFSLPGGKVVQIVMYPKEDVK